MVFVSPDFSEAMKDGGSPSGREIGYAFALPRLIARLGGRRARRAELSRWEAYGMGILVFGISCVFVAHTLLPVVRPAFAQLLVLLLLPFAVWVAFLLLYYVNSLMTALLRRFGLYSAMTNNPFQHFVIMSLTTLLALTPRAGRKRLDEIAGHLLARTLVPQPDLHSPPQIPA